MAYCSPARAARRLQGAPSGCGPSILVPVPWSPAHTALLPALGFLKCPGCPWRPGPSSTCGRKTGGVNVREAAPDQWEPGDWQRGLPILTGGQRATRCTEFSAEEGPPGGSPRHGSVWPACTHVPAAIPVPQPYCRWPSSWRARLCLSLCFWGTLGPNTHFCFILLWKLSRRYNGRENPERPLSPSPSGNTARGQPGVNPPPPTLGLPRTNPAHPYASPLNPPSIPPKTQSLL